MALWQFVLDLIPSSEAVSDGVVVERIDLDRLDAINLNFPRSTTRSIMGRIGSMLPEAQRSTPGLRVWGDDKTDDAQASFDGDILEYVQFRLDLNHLSLPLVEKICSLARDVDCVLATDDGTIVPPHCEMLVRVIAQSDGARFVNDPARYVREASLLHPAP